MINVLSLTKDEADAVRGVTSAGAALNPIPFEDGFILGLQVLEDPRHAKHKELLASLPIIEVSLEG